MTLRFFFVLCGRTITVKMKSYLSYRKLNNIGGWVVFLIAAAVYTMTAEPTTSFWDCGEFILASHGLQIGHPPGAPIYLMLGRLFSLFAGGDALRVAFMVNMLSVIASAFTIMFLFWSVTHMVRKVYRDDESDCSTNRLVVLCAGAVGSLAYAFTDTFWFSAVEAEVYALSSLFTAIVFWAMLRWEESADRPGSGRWLILIAYLMGLSIGVHLLNLLALPALVMIYYFKRYEVTWQGFFGSLLISVFMLAVLVFGIIPGLPAVAGWSELLFVNGLGLPFNSGLYVFAAALIAASVMAIRYSLRKRLFLLNHIVTAVVVIIIGYSSFVMVMVRANAAPPMNQNDPSDIFSFINYINREQYGSVPLLYGHTFDAPHVSIKKTLAGYNRVEGRYEPYYRTEYEYDSDFKLLFTRMYSNDPSHIAAYYHWGGIRGRRPPDRRQEGATRVVPTFGENFRFFMKYQIGFMYWRYFMWNFAGRQNDIQGNGNAMYGNWISGIPVIDNARLGDQSLMPEDLKNNRGRNRYYLLPLLAGIAGLVWQLRRDDRDFMVVLTLFFMTGLAIIVYLNQTPDQPRERDYAYAGSFYAFSLWIGMGMVWLYELLKGFMAKRVAAPLSFGILMAGVPLLLISENWDDHDRSDRYTARDIASNYLNSCDKNGVLFTYGDNDSFPLWYVQEVEGVRRDLRVVNLSYLQAGWYIRMLLKRAYESAPLPLTLTKEHYFDGRREIMPVDRSVERAFDSQEVLDIIARDDREVKIDITGRGDFSSYFPVHRFSIPVDTNLVRENGTVPGNLSDRVVSPLVWAYPGNVAYKSDLAILDLLTGNRWERPVYFSTTVPGPQFRGLDRFFIQGGLAFRLSPVDFEGLEITGQAYIDTDRMYDNMVNRFSWGNAEKPSVYLDETNRRMFSNYRRLFGLLANALIDEGDYERAVVAATRSVELVPPDKMAYDYFMVETAVAMLRMGLTDEAMELIDSIRRHSVEHLRYVMSLSPRMRDFGFDFIVGVNLQTLFEIYQSAVDYDLEDLRVGVENELNIFYPELYPLVSD